MSLGSSSQMEGGESASTLDHCPLWRYVTRLPKTNEGGGNLPFKCNFCKMEFKGSYSRMKCHLLKIKGNGIRSCVKVDDSLLMEMKKLEDEAVEKKERSQSRMAPLSHAYTSSSQSSCRSHSVDAFDCMRQEKYVPKKRRVAGDTPLEKAFNIQAREELDTEIAKMFYSAGLPFNLARNPHYVRAFQIATNSNISGYVPPGYNALRTTMMAKERKSIESSLEPTKSTWKNTGVTLVTDGWTDPQRRPLINFMAISEAGTMFIRAVNCEGQYKDKFFISQLIKEVIVEVGVTNVVIVEVRVTNVVQVITDNAPVCKAAGMLVEQAYPEIFWTPCIVHTLNLALKSICAAKNTEANEITYDECHWISEVVASAVKIKNFISNHSMRLAMFIEFSKLKLIVVADTRFASMIIMLKRFKLIKQELLAMVVSERWSSYRDDDYNKARLVKEKILDDEWWDSIEYILEFTNPIYRMIRECDTDKPCLHLVYEMWDSMISQVRESIYKHEQKNASEYSSFWSVVHIILEDRWSKSNTPLHCLAYSLNPRRSSKEYQAKYPEIIPPQLDTEIARMTKICMKRLVPNEDARKPINEELAKFFGCFEDFGDGDSLRDRLTMNPMHWWTLHGYPTPNLQKIAIRLLGHVSSSSCSERNWSTYSFIHSAKRNLITPQRAENLVFIHSNLRLLSRKNPLHMKGPTKMWDVAGDAFELNDDVGILEISNLTLDEPELEIGLLDEVVEMSLITSENLEN